MKHVLSTFVISREFKLAVFFQRIRVGIRMFYRSKNLYSILAFVSIFFILFSGCSSPRLGLKTTYGESKVYESKLSYEDKDFSSWYNNLWLQEHDEESWTNIGKDSYVSIYPILTYLPEGNFGLTIEVSPIWIGVNNFSSDGKGVNSDNATQFTAQGISTSLGLIISFDVPELEYMFFGDIIGTTKLSFEWGEGIGLAHVTLDKCVKESVRIEGQMGYPMGGCKKDDYNNKLENILNENVRVISAKYFRISTQQDRDTMQKQSDAMGMWGTDPFSDYMIFEFSTSSLIFRGSNKKEYVINDNSLGYKFVWGVLF